MLNKSFSKLGYCNRENISLIIVEVKSKVVLKDRKITLI